MVNPTFWKGRRVFLTGHTGFKGGWLAAWLLRMGAKVTGYSLRPDTTPSFFALTRLGRRMDSRFGDIRDLGALRRAVSRCRPQVIFHLAAQSLVRRSYLRPVETFATNVMGTVHLLDAVGRVPTVGAVVVVTSDKCYENQEDGRVYREGDPLGGNDPYSASKASAEHVIRAWRSVFFGRSPGLASVRAGNVIGGGDWAEDRLVPDAVRALVRGRAVKIRNPVSVRPWQHVLDPLAGYLMLAERLFAEPSGVWRGEWNFGPSDGRPVTTKELARRVVLAWGSGRVTTAPQRSAAPEAGTLRLDSSKARRLLGWHPRISLPTAVEMTVDWYRRRGSEAFAATCAQIDGYGSLGPTRGS